MSIPPVVVLDATVFSQNEYQKFKPYGNLATNIVTTTSVTQILRDNQTKIFAEQVFGDDSPYTLEADQSRLLLDTNTISYGPIFGIPTGSDPKNFYFLPVLKGRLLINSGKISTVKLLVLPEQDITVENATTSRINFSKLSLNASRKVPDSEDKIELIHTCHAQAFARLSPYTSVQVNSL